MSVCLIAVGSNQGNSAAIISKAFTEIGGIENTRLLRKSSLIDTAPVGAASQKFLNGCLLIETTRPPELLMRDLLEIETALGRTRVDGELSDRTIDLDVLLYDDRIVRSDSALIPHPRMSFRRFVLEPAVEIAADMRHPLFDASMNELLACINKPDKRILVVASSPLLARPRMAETQIEGWSIEYIDPAENGEHLEARLKQTSLLIEFADPPLERSQLWRPDYGGPRWQLGTDNDLVLDGQFDSLIRIAVQSMNRQD